MVHKCDRCGKGLTKKHEIEYSCENGKFYCSPDCATDSYFDEMRSRPLTYNEMLKKKKEL